MQQDAESATAGRPQSSKAKSSRECHPLFWWLGRLGLGLKAGDAVRNGRATLRGRYDFLHQFEQRRSWQTGLYSKCARMVFHAFDESIAGGDEPCNRTREFFLNPNHDCENCFHGNRRSLLERLNHRFFSCISKRGLGRINIVVASRFHRHSNVCDLLAA